MAGFGNKFFAARPYVVDVFQDNQLVATETTLRKREIPSLKRKQRERRAGHKVTFNVHR